MKILPLYKVIVGLQGCVYKIDSLYGGSLKLEDRDFPSYLSSQTFPLREVKIDT